MLADLLNTTYVSGTKLRTSQPPYRVGTVMLQVFHMRVLRVDSVLRGTES